MINAELEKNLALLKAVELLKKSWRLFGLKKAVTIETLDTVRAILLELNPQPELVLARLGFFQLEFENDRKDYLEFSHLTSDDTCSVYFEYTDEPGARGAVHSKKAMIVRDTEKIKMLLQLFMEQKYEELKGIFITERQPYPPLF